ncbi:MAG: glycerol kinase GlpK [Ktedonobacterales bacterium]|nr:glycerol kinase GlpK [Ktedonobacterales bacterium]
MAAQGRYVLALDQGTTSSRAILFDHVGRAIAAQGQEFPQIFPQPGWVEHDPEAIWSSQLAVAQAVVRQAGLGGADIAAIGITNQRETTLVWDRATGAPVMNAIVWQDRRTAALCDQLKAEGWEPRIREKTGLVLDAYFSGTKLAWMLDHLPGLRARGARGEVLFGTVDSYLIWRLSGGRAHVTDYSNASRTLLFDIHTLTWDEELLARLDIPTAMLPQPRQSSEVYAETDAALFGVPIPIAGDAGDQQAATFGQACFEPGTAKNTYGTGSFLLLNTGEQPRRSANGMLTTIGWGLGGRVTYCLEGSIFITGAAVQWLRDALGIISQADETEALAASLPDTGGVYLVPAFAGLGAPYWDPYARGALVGLTRGSGRAEIARAALEAACYQTRDVVQAMAADAGIALTELRVDGGMVVNNWLMQFQADILDVTVQRPLVAETSALGAAYLAGLAVGYWSGLEDVTRNWAVDRVFTPHMEEERRTRLYHGWQRAVERARAWAEPEGH